MSPAAILVVLWAIVAAILALLWILPGIVFPHPGINDGIELAALGPLLFIATLSVSLLSLIGIRWKGWSVGGPIGQSLFLFGVVAAFVLSIVAFGNASDDRFMPLFFTPVLGVPFAGALLFGGMRMRRRLRENLAAGILRTGVAVAVVTFWLLARGPRDWLQAPYGFDVYALIAVVMISLLFFPLKLGLRDQSGIQNV